VAAEVQQEVRGVIQREVGWGGDCTHIRSLCQF
jgi:hypothetical protein